jgi:hypothetical protein
MNAGGVPADTKSLLRDRRCALMFNLRLNAAISGLEHTSLNFLPHLGAESCGLKHYKGFRALQAHLVLKLRGD